MVMSARAKAPKPSIVLRLLIIVFCAYLIYSLGSLVVQLKSKNSELASIEKEKVQVEANVLEYYQLLNGPKEEIIKKAARERLGYAFPNEMVYMDISGK